MSATNKVMYINKEEVCQLKLTGTRMYTARESVNITQEQAAQLLGTSKQAIADLERGKLNPMPLKLLKAAAELFHCSSDWLLGLSDDWENDPALIRERDFLAGIYRIHLKNYAEVTERQNEIQEIEMKHHQLTAAVAEITEAFEKFRELNPGFENMLGGARLLHSIKAAKNTPLIRENVKKTTINA